MMAARGWKSKAILDAWIYFDCGCLFSDRPCAIDPLRFQQWLVGLALSIHRSRNP
jgi:hypothetical protein